MNLSKELQELRASVEILNDKYKQLKADLTTESGQKLCFHFSNLQVISFEENMRKSDYLPNGDRARYLSPHQQISTLEQYNKTRYGKQDEYYDEAHFNDEYCF